MTDETTIYKDVFLNKGYVEIELPAELDQEGYNKIIDRHADESRNYKETSFKPYIEFPQVFRKRIADLKKRS